MKCFLPVLLLSVLVLIGAITLACGTSSPQNHVLQSIAVNPASADANGKAVQFTATGTYDKPPIHVTPQPATWGACYQNVPTSDVSVTSNGLAQCASGAAGIYTVFAFDPGNKGCVAVDPCGNGTCIITGSAQLTCP
jgi:hypothetical protein